MRGRDLSTFSGNFKQTKKKRKKRMKRKKNAYINQSTGVPLLLASVCDDDGGGELTREAAVKKCPPWCLVPSLVIR